LPVSQSEHILRSWAGREHRRLRDAEDWQDDAARILGQRLPTDGTPISATTTPGYPYPFPGTVFIDHHGNIGVQRWREEK